MPINAATAMVMATGKERGEKKTFAKAVTAPGRLNKATLVNGRCGIIQNSFLLAYFKSLYPLLQGAIASPRTLRSVRRSPKLIPLRLSLNAGAEGPGGIATRHAHGKVQNKLTSDFLLRPPHFIRLLSSLILQFNRGILIVE